MPIATQEIIAGTNDCILVWPWEEAPSIFKDASHNGGDQDYVALVPKKYLNHRMMMTWEGKFFVCDIEKIDLDDDYELWIGVHA